MKKENNNANKRPVSMTDFGVPKTGLKNTKKAFTLVELIIVITILAILATIAFVSFQSFTKDARDGNRVATLSNIEKGLELLVIKTGTYPMPEEYSTGSINGTTYAYKGTIQDNISRLINISKTPIDPLSDDYYVYATTINKREYQIATTLETLQTYNPVITPAHADAGNTAKVNGNYKGYFIFSSGSNLYYANIPSLIWSNTGSVNLLSTGSELTSPRYIIDKGTNIVYNPNGKPLTTEEITNQKLPDIIVKEKTKKEDAQLVVVLKTELEDFVKNPDTATLPAGISSGTLLSSFNVDTVENLDFVVLGNTSVTTSTNTQNEEGESTPTPISCPTGFVLVPGNNDFTYSDGSPTSDFCVAKYEMKWDSTGTIGDNTNMYCGGSNNYSDDSCLDGKPGIISKAEGKPLTRVNQQDAIQLCKNIGPGYHLITNNEWMTIARNIEQVDDNWSGGSKGNGGIYGGITGETNSTTSLGCGGFSSGQAANTIDTTLWGSAKSNDCQSKRQHKLSNGQVIWDISGNVWEHVNRGNDITATSTDTEKFTGDGTICGASGYWYNNGNPSNTCGTTQGPINRAGGSDIGMGYVRHNTNTTGRIFIRGGDWNRTTLAGVFTLGLDLASAGAYTYLGFRCAFSVN